MKCIISPNWFSPTICRHRRLAIYDSNIDYWLCVDNPTYFQKVECRHPDHLDLKSCSGVI